MQLARVWDYEAGCTSEWCPVLICQKSENAVSKLTSSPSSIRDALATSIKNLIMYA